MSDLPPGFIVEPQKQPVAGLPDGFTVETPGMLTGATDAAARWATFGLVDPVSAAGRAAVQKYALGEDKPFGDLYSRNLAQERGRAENFATAHPYVNAAAATAGALASAAPAMGWPTANRTGAALLEAPAQGLGRQMATGAGLGALAGGGNALDASPNNDPLAIAKDVGIGALGGAATGAAIPLVAAPANRGLSALARAVIPGSVDRQAAQLVAGRVGQDAAAGGPGAAAMQSDLAGATKPYSLLDVAGENTRALGGRLARAQGEPRQIAAQFLNDRDVQSGPRLLDDVRTMISNGKDAFSTAQDLMRARSAAAQPLYTKALSAGPINDPAVLDLVKNSSILRNTINSARANYPQFGALAPNDMALLDQAYKDIGGRAAEATRSGNGALANNLNNLRGDFKAALVRANPDYGDALTAFSGPSDSLNAVELGKKIFNQPQPETESLMAKMTPTDQDFFRVGAAQAIRDRIMKTGSGGNEARAIVGNQEIQNRVRPLFGSDADFQNFINAAKGEDRMFQTRYDVLGNSRTAARAAEDASGHAGAGPLSNLVGAGTAFYGHEPMVGVGLLARALSAVNRLPEIQNPQVNAAAARMLFNSDPAANANSLAAILAGRAPVRAGVTAPAAGLAGQLYPSLEFSPRADKPRVTAAGAP